MEILFQERFPAVVLAGRMGLKTRLSTRYVILEENISFAG